MKRISGVLALLIMLVTLIVFSYWRSREVPSLPRESAQRRVDEGATNSPQLTNSPDNSEYPLLEKNRNSNISSTASAENSGIMPTEFSEQVGASSDLTTNHSVPANATDVPEEPQPVPVRHAGLPERLLLPAEQLRLVKRDRSRLHKSDLKVLDFINAERQNIGLAELPTLPTGLNDQECLELLNAMRERDGLDPLAQMPTGARVPDSPSNRQ